MITHFTGRMSLLLPRQQHHCTEIYDE